MVYYLKQTYIWCRLLPKYISISCIVIPYVVMVISLIFTVLWILLRDKKILQTSNFDETSLSFYLMLGPRYRMRFLPLDIILKSLKFNQFGSRLSTVSIRFHSVVSLTLAPGLLVLDAKHLSLPIKNHWGKQV